MKRYHDSAACASRQHCPTCRSPDGEAWRKSIATHFAWDSDYSCPLGLRIGEPVPVTVSATAAQRPPAYTPRFPLPGDRLSAILHAIGISEAEGCQCKSRAATMNRDWIALEQAHPDASYRRLMAIYLRRHAPAVGLWLVSEALRRGVVVGPARALRAVRGAFRREGEGSAG